jgi:hypothetical protein
MAKRFTASEKWDDPWFRSLPNDYKCLWVFICDKCDTIGIWKVDFEMVGFCFKNEAVNPNEALQFFNKGKERIRVLNCGSTWLVMDFINFQYGELSQNNSFHRSIILKLEKLGVLTGCQESVQGHKDKVKVKDKVKEKVDLPGNDAFPPTLEMVQQYCVDRKNLVDPNRWLDFYAAKGWMIGKNRMKDWKAAVRTWEKDSQTNSSQNDGLTPEIRESLRKIKESNAKITSCNR